MIILFAYNKHNEQPLSEGIAAGAKSIPVEQAVDYFNVGDDIFIADAAAGTLEYLGQAGDVSSTAVTVPYATASAYPAGAGVWRPAAFFRFTTGTASPLHSRLDTGVAVRRSLGGTEYGIRTREPRTIIDLTIPDLPRRVYRTFEEWLADTTDNGLQPFTFVDNERQVTSVRLLNETIEYEENQPGFATLNLTLSVHDEGEYM